MPIYEITAPDGKTYEIEGPPGATQREIEDEVLRQKPFAGKTTEALKQIPSAPSTLRDINEMAAMSLAGGIKGLSDLFGVDNAVSKYFGEKQTQALKQMTPERRREMEIEEELAKRAEGKPLEEFTTAGRAFLRSPAQSLVGGAMSSVPMIAATALAPEVTLPAALTARLGTGIAGKVAAKTAAASPAIGVGAAMGVGSQKGQDYEAVKQAMLERGASEEEAEAAAQKAAEYSMQNAARQAASGIAGGLEGAIGVESVLGRMGRGRAGVSGAPTAPTWKGAAVQSTLGEAIPEAIQAGTGAIGTNVALQQAGFDRDLTAGVIGQVTNDALTGALLGTAVTPLQKRSMQAEFDKSQLERQLKEDQERQQKIDTVREQLGVDRQLLALPAPAQRIEEPPVTDVLNAPFGSFARNELPPEVVKYIDDHRAQMGRPGALPAYSIEDIKDAMPGINPEGEAAYIDSLLTAKSGYTGDITYNPKTVMDVAGQKNVATGTKGFADFLTRVTGVSDLNSMSQPQLHAAFTALTNLPNPEEGSAQTILPEGTNALRFSDDQFMRGYTAVLDEIAASPKNEVSPAQAIEAIKAASGIQNDADAKRVFDLSLKGGAIDVNKEGNVTAPAGIESLPAGYEVREGTFKQGEQQEYAINAGDRPLEGIPTFADTQQALEKLATLEEQRQKQAELADKKIEALQKKLQESQENLDGMEAAGEANTQEYKVASAAHDALNKDLNARMLTLQKRRDNLLQPLSIQPAGMKMVTRQGFTVFENGAPKATFPTKDAAIDSVVLGLPDERLNEAAAGKLPSQRTVARKAQQELDRRQGKVEPGIKVKGGEKAEQMAEVLTQALKKFGLEDVGLKIVAGMKDEGSYAGRLIKIALDAESPIGVLRHESIHALKDMGFFTPQQWSTLEKMAKTKWIDQYLRQRNINGDPLQPGEQSRFDAYVDIYGGNMNDVIEEAIADAFRDFDANKAPPGMLTALLKRMKDFFEALGNALRGLGYQTAEDIFGKVEAGLLKATAKPAEGKARASLAAKKEKEIDPNDISRLVVDGPYANSALRVIDSQIGKTSKPLKVDEVGVLFDQAYLDEFKRQGDWKNPSDMQRATAQAVTELTRQLQEAKSGLDWYDEDITEAFKLTQRYIPSLKKPEKRALFSVIAGIMSPSTMARDNWVIAAQAYQHYEKTGILPGVNPANGSLWMGGLESANKKKQLDMLNAMLQPKSKGGLGEKAAVEWLQGDHTVAEINQFRAKYGGMGKSSVGGKMSDILPGFTMFGPKVGPFVMNINGLHEVTVDVWLTRTFNRYFGQMIGPDGKMLRAPTEPQRVAIKKLVNDAAGQLGIKPYQVQSVLWFFEQNLFNKLGTGAKSYGFSDGAIKFIESQGGVGTAKGSPANIGTDETADRTAREQAVGVGVQAGKPSIRTTEQGVTGEAIRSGKPSIRPGDQGGRGITESDRARQRGDRSGRGSRRGFAPLAGAPVVQGATGPDPEIVKVAEAYAAKNNIPYVPQATYVEIDEDRAKRLAQAYEDMPHAPQDPAVKAAYKDLIQQTKAQYDALVDAGYEFTFFDSNTDPYGGNPWNAMRDLRQNKRMAVYGTYDGYGTEGITDSEIEGNPMLEDTGLRWKDQNGDEQIVTANDLFRAVHDAFGHGIEGAGFRARGEENAWQAHARLFTGPALGAITSETRGQNSWLNYGPYGDKNKTAKLEDTVFAEQKTGLMPEWTWTEGLAESEGIVLGEMQPGAASFKGTHYGNAKVDTLNGDKYGTGIRGAERRRVEEGWDDRIRRRVYFYIPKPDGTTPIPEAGLGQYVYTQKFDNILPQGEVMSKLYSQANGKPNEFESAIVDAGYDGYAIPEMGMMVILNHNTPVNYQGTRAEQLAKKSLRSNLFVKRLNNVGIKDVDDFWNRWQNLLIGSGTSRPGLSGVASKISRQDDIKQTVSVWKADVERHGMRKYLHKYLNKNGQRDKDDDIVTSNIARKILESAGIKPTLKNVVWAYNSLPGHVVAANDENLIKSIPDDYDQESIFKSAPYERFPKAGKNWLTGEDIVEPEAANEKYSLRIFNKNDLPQNKKEYTLPANTMLYHGAHEERAKEIENSGRILLSRSLIKTSSGTLDEGGLIFFGDINTATGYAKAERDLMSVEAARRRGESRNPGIVFETATDRPYRLMNKDYKLSKKEADKLNDVLGIPDYKMLEQGDIADTAATRALSNSNTVDRYKTNKGEMAVIWPKIFEALGYDGFYDSFAIALPANNGIRLIGKEGKMERFSLRTPPKSPEFQAYMAGSKMVDKDGNPQVWYHGTARNISIFRPKQAASIFLTQDPDFAAGFSEDSLNWMAKNAADELTAEQKARAIDDAVAKVQKDYDFVQKDDPDFRKLTKQKNDVISELENNSFSKRKMGDEAMDYLMQASKEYFPSGPNIMPLYVRAVKPFDFANKEHLDMVMRKAQEYFDMSKMEFPEKFLIGKKGLISRGLWQAIEAEPVQKAIRALGFDSYFIKEGGIKNLAVYSPAQVASATGNIGAFKQRTPTFDEALNLGMTREEAIEAQKAGDIRLSLRGKKLDQSTLDAVNRITYAREEKGWVKRFTDALHNTSLRQAFVDRYDTIYENTKRVAASKGEAQLFADVSAHSAALLSDQAAGVAAQAMGLNNRSGGIPIYKNGGTFIFNDNGKIKGPLEIFKPLAAYGDPEVYRHYQFWAGSKRGARLMADGKEHLYTPADIREAKKLEKEYPEFVTIQKEWDTYNRGLVNYMIDTGVISRSSGMEWMKYGDYIPFYRQLDGTPTVGPKVFQALSGVKAPKTLKGGENPLGDFLENVVRNTQAAIESGMKNVAAQRVVRDALFLREAEKIQGPFKADINTVSVLENGKQVNYHLADAMLAEAMKGLRMAEIPFLSIAAAPANLLRSVVTKMPDFIGANLMRDSLSAYVTSGAKLTPVIDTIRNFGAAIADKSPALETLRSYGVIGGYDLAQNVEKSGRDLAKDLRKKTGTQTKKEKILSATGIMPLWEALEKGSAASDAATRMAVFEATMKETGNEVEAAFRAMEVMNFSRKGNSAVIRILTAITPFLNARIQGLDVLYRAGIRPILRGATPTEQEKAIAKSFYIRGMTLASLSVMYYMLTHDDDDYKKQEQETRDNNWLIPSLGIKIPIPFEVGVIFKVLPERITAYMLGNDTGQDLMQSAKRNLTSTFGMQPPQAVLPVLEVVTNYSFFTGREIVGQGMQDIDKQFQVNPNTTKLAQAIGNLTSFKTATGKSWGVSPIEIDHLISGYLGGLGMYMADAIDTVIDMNSDIPKASKRFEQMPVIKRFALDPKARGNVTAYYDLKNAVDETVRTDNYLTRTMKMDAKGEYMQDYAGLLLTKDYVNSLEKSMKEFREMKTMIQNSPMSADDKRDALSAVIDAENSLTANIKDIRKAIQ